MKTKRTFLSINFVALILSASVAPAMPAQVLIIRHGEKPASGNELSEQGWARAHALVQYFETNSAVTRFGTPVAIYATRPGSSDGSVRMIETVTPLAQALGIKINTSYQRDDIEPLVTEVLSNTLYNGKMVLICWEHKVINSIAESLGVTPPPAKWPDSVFDGVWEIDFSDNHVSAFTNLWQHVLPGDH